MHIYSKETGICNHRRMLAAAGTARRLKTAWRARIYDNQSKRNDATGEDGGGKNKVLIMMDDTVFHLQEQDVCAGAWC